MVQLILLLFLVLVPSATFGQVCTNYVSPTGSATWAESANVATPTSPTTAFANADDDDVVCFRGGTYTVPAKNFGDSHTGYYAPTNSGSSGHPITFKAYSGETPVFNGTTGGSGDDAGQATVMGVYRQAYITFDGFTFMADSGVRMVKFSLYSDDPSDYVPATAQPTHHIIIKNCTFNGGSTVINSTDNREGLRIEDVDDSWVQNCVLYNYKSVGDYHNTSAIKFYHVDNITVENCEIYNSTVGIYDKSGSSGSVFRYNFIHDNASGIYASCAGYSNRYGYVYHNIVINSTLASILIEEDDGGENTDGWEVYNNTMYNASSADRMLELDYGSDWHVHSNISYGSTSGYGKIRVKSPLSTDELDYNSYYGGTFSNYINYTNYSSISSWRSASVGGINPDAHGITSDPLFVAATGDRDTIAEFALQAGSPCKGTGKNGVDMGADVTLVGVTPSASSSVGTISNITIGPGVSLR